MIQINTRDHCFPPNPNPTPGFLAMQKTNQKKTKKNKKKKNIANKTIERDVGIKVVIETMNNEEEMVLRKEDEERKGLRREKN